jgi:hypothetical protein
MVNIAGINLPLNPAASPSSSPVPQISGRLILSSRFRPALVAHFFVVVFRVFVNMLKARVSKSIVSCIQIDEQKNLHLIKMPANSTAKTTTQ